MKGPVRSAFFANFAKGGSGLASRMANASPDSRAESTAQAAANARWAAEIANKSAGRNSSVDYDGTIEICPVFDC